MNLSLHLIDENLEIIVEEFIQSQYDKKRKTREIAEHFQAIMEILGLDVNDPGLKDTPTRVGKYLYDFCLGYEPGNTGTVFENLTTDQMVVVKGIPFWSLCEHHFLPFCGEISVGYIAQDKVIGLSKIPRIVQQYAHRPQLQERLVHQIADEVQLRIPSALGIAVYGTAEHTCMQMRGIKSDGTMVTSVVRGAFDNPTTKEEFMAIVR